MERRRTKPGRVVVLAMVGIAAALAAVSHTSLNAQEPAKPSARGALRQKIADLRGEVALREVEHETDREILKQKLMRVPIIMQQIEEFRAELLSMKTVDSLPGIDFEAKDHILVLAKKLGTTDETLEPLGKALDEAIKTKEPKALVKAVLKWLEGGEARARTEIDKELAPLKKDFVRHASQLCLKKLELEDLEKQYRDSR